MTFSPKKSSVLFIRLSAIGDIVMASGLPSSIKHHFNGNVRVVWLVESPYTSIVNQHPAVDEVIAWPKNEWSRLAKQHKYILLIKAILQFRKTLKQEGFTVAVDAQGLLKSAFLGWLSGAPRRVGFKSKEFAHWFLTESYEKPLSEQISSEYRFLGQKFSQQPYTLTVATPCSSVSELEDVLATIGLKGAYIALAPYTTRPQKHWVNNHWHALVDAFHKLGYRTLVLGGPSDKQAAQQLCHSHDGCFNAAGSLSLIASAAAVAKCQLFIGVDTGLTHMAVGLNKPTIALFGSTRPYTQTDNPLAKILYTAIECAPCKRKPSCNTRFDCMQQLTPERVLQTAQELLPL